MPTQFQLRISLQQFMVETIREQGSATQRSKAITFKNENRNMNAKNHTVEEKALMQRVWKDSSQATQAKELCAEAAKLRRTMTRTNPDRTSQAKK